MKCILTYYIRDLISSTLGISVTHQRSYLTPLTRTVMLNDKLIGEAACRIRVLTPGLITHPSLAWSVVLAQRVKKSKSIYKINKS